MRTWEDRNPRRPAIGLGIGMLVIAILLLVAILALGGKVGATVNPDANQVSYWCPNGGVKYEDPGTPFTVPGLGPWTLLVLKAGSEESANPVNEQFPNPVVGQLYSRTDGKDISHAILCYGVPPTTTTAPTTTGASTTLATTTTGATTTLCEECTIDTQVITTTTSPTTTQPTTTIATTTTAATTTVPQTTTTAGSCAPLCAGQFGTTTTLPTTTTVAATTSTATPTMTVVAHGPAALVTTAVDQTVPTTTPTTLPVTGGNFWWLILFGSCMVALGLLIIAWTRPA